MPRKAAQNRRIRMDPSPTVPVLLRYIWQLDHQKAAMMRALNALGGKYRRAPATGSSNSHPATRKGTHVSTKADSHTRPDEVASPTRKAKGHPRTLDQGLYSKTLAIVRQAKQPLAGKEVRARLRAQHHPDSSAYYHLVKAVKAGQVVKDAKGLYSRPPVATPAE